MSLETLLKIMTERVLSMVFEKQVIMVTELKQ